MTTVSEANNNQESSVLKEILYKVDAMGYEDQTRLLKWLNKNEILELARKADAKVSGSVKMTDAEIVEFCRSVRMEAYNHPNYLV